jgi:Spy/CpxP family protein refolding chaperone
MGEGYEHGGPGMGGGPMGHMGDELGLTPEQKEKLHTKLEAQMKAQHAMMKEKMAATEKHMEAIGTAFESDKFDAKKAGVGTQAPDMVKAMATAKVQMAETVLSVLTPEQRPKFLAQIKEHEAEMD